MESATESLRADAFARRFGLALLHAGRDARGGFVGLLLRRCGGFAVGHGCGCGRCTPLGREFAGSPLLPLRFDLSMSLDPSRAGVTTLLHFVWRKSAHLVTPSGGSKALRDACPFDRLDLPPNDLLAVVRGACGDR